MITQRALDLRSTMNDLHDRGELKRYMDAFLKTVATTCSATAEEWAELSEGLELSVENLTYIQPYVESLTAAQLQLITPEPIEEPEAEDGDEDSDDAESEDIKEAVDAEIEEDPAGNTEEALEAIATEEELEVEGDSDEEADE